MRRLLAVPLLLCSVMVTWAPAEADFSPPVSVTPEGVHAEAADQATDREGDTAYAFAANGYFNVRIRSVGGALSPVLPLAPIDFGWWTYRVAVDDDGDGVAVWDQQWADGYTGKIFARRFSRDGELGPLLQVSPPDHDAPGEAEVALRPSGAAVITWTRYDDDLGGPVPYVRTLSLANALGPALRVGAGPNAMVPLIAMDRTGRATLVWSNNRLLVRRLSTSGTLSPIKVVNTEPFANVELTPSEVALDRRGVLTIGCLRWTPNTAPVTTFPPNENSYLRGCLIRLSSELRPLGPAQHVSQAKIQIDGVDLGIAPNGAGTIAWQKTSAEGAWVRRIRLDGSLGPQVKIANGTIGDSVLASNGDGVVTSVGIAFDGRRRIIRATTITNGAIGSTRRVAVNDYDTSYLRTARTPGGRNMISWNEELDQPHIWLITGR